MSWTPHLDEKDARKIATHVVTELHALGGHIGRFSIFLEQEGFYFVADTLNSTRDSSIFWIPVDGKNSRGE